MAGASMRESAKLVRHLARSGSGPDVSRNATARVHRKEDPNGS